MTLHRPHQWLVDLGENLNQLEGLLTTEVLAPLLSFWFLRLDGVLRTGETDTAGPDGTLITTDTQDGR